MAESPHAGHRERLRESAKYDPELNTFSDFQVLEFLLSFTIPRKDTNPIAHELISKFGDLYGVFQATADELYEVPNMTSNAAHLLANFYSIYRKSEISRTRNKGHISNSAEAIDVLAPYFMGLNEERVYCIALDLNDKVLQVVELGRGLADSAVIDNNKIFAIVTRTRAKKIVLAHNHPGGANFPSQQDIDATISLFMVLRSVGAVLSDHIIFTNNNYFSFYLNGLFDEAYQKTDKAYGTSYYSESRIKRLSGTYVYEPLQSECEE